MEELFQSGSIDQKRSSTNWPLAKILQRYINHVTRRLGLNVGERCPRSATRNALFVSGFIRNFQSILGTQKRQFWEFWADHLKSRLQLNHVPVRKTHSTKVMK
jgi:hypothetical protein